ncbi:hypothetical protein HY949_02130 [Candidatus Gottesmanbacteria bacterium]|nr:hypothetical protein [Candidatus Gottesmanbacteria bacterium]
MVEKAERSLPKDVWAAHTLAGKIHVDGAKPLTRLGGAAAVGVLGVIGEKLVDTFKPKLLKKLETETLPLSKLLTELIDDGLVGVVYTIVNTQLDKALPKLKFRHFTTSTIGTVLVAGVEGMGGKLDDMGKKRKEKILSTAAEQAKQTRKTSGDLAPATDASADQVKVSPTESNTIGEQATTPPENTEKKRSLLEYINPVTALGTDEARMAVMDWWNAYKAVTSGTEEAFVKSRKPKDPKEPTITKETTIIFLGNDQQLASALSTVSGDQGTL